MAKVYLNTKMLAIPRNGRGQAFSVDVLLAMMPLMMLLGAGLQYLYLAEEDMKDINYRTTSEDILESFSDNVFYEKDFSIQAIDCSDFKSKLDSSDSDNLPGDYVYQVVVEDRYSNNAMCTDPTIELWSVPSGNPYTSRALKNTMSTETRFVVQYDDLGTIIPGKIAEVSIAVWEDT